MAKGAASQQSKCWNARRTLVNTDELEYALYKAERRVLEIQTKLHRWSGDDPHRRFDDLYNLVCDSRFFWWRGIACGTTGAHARPEWTV